MSLAGKTRARIHRSCARHRELLEACVESDGEPTFTAAEVDAEVQDRYDRLVARAMRGADLIERHE